MAHIDALYLKQEKIYRACCEINNCDECPHNNGRRHIDCDLTLVSREIEQQAKGGK
jgi:hypothetical protein